MSDSPFASNQHARAGIASLVMQHLGKEWETAAGQFADRFLGMVAARMRVCDEPVLDREKIKREFATAMGNTVALTLGLLGTAARARRGESEG